MYLRKSTIILIFTCLLAAYGTIVRGEPQNSSGGRTNYTPDIDSLRRIIENSSPEEALKHHQRMHSLMYELGDSKVHLDFNRQFAEAAKSHGDKLSEAIARVFRIEALYNYRMPDSLIMAESLLALEFLRGIPGAEFYYFYTAGIVGDIYMLAGNYTEALEFAEKFYNEAKKTGNSSG